MWVSTMEDINLILKFRLSGETHFQIHGVSRIKLDGRGKLTYYDVQSHKTETVDFERLRSLSLSLINSDRKTARAGHMKVTSGLPAVVQQ
jgi:hypothetical protein